jgi:hypothetical protein
MSQVIFLKWSPSINEQFYEKSKLEDKHKAIGNNVMETILQEGHNFIDNETTRENRFKSSHELYAEPGFSNTGTKREDNFERMNQREMVAQTNKNPFLSSNYLEDLQVQENFLTPQNSNMGLDKYSSYTNE